MKLLVLLFMLNACVALGQPKQQSSIDVKGANNIIKVIQGNNITVYNLDDKKDQQKFLQYLETLPGIKKDIRKILQYSEKTFVLLSKAVDGNVFNPEAFAKVIESYVKENEKLKAENARLKEQTVDADFKKALEEANKKLAVYDNEGYQQVLENFKFLQKNKINQKQQELANAAYLQAKNSYNNYKLAEALIQIDEALTYDKTNFEYLLIKGQIFVSVAKNNESINLFQQALAVANNDTLSSIACSYLGNAYNERGDIYKALEYFQKELAICEKIFGKEHPGTAASYGNVGFIYYRMGELDKALELYRKDLHICERVYGTDNPKTATSYHNIGLAYNEKGAYDKALAFFQKASLIYEKAYGKEHPTTANSYDGIASAYQEKEAFDTALFFYQKALSIREKVYGKEHPLMSTSYNNIGSVYSEKKEYDKALEFYWKALVIREKLLGKEHTTTAIYYNNIGMVFYNKGELDKALEFFEKALAIKEKMYGNEHAGTGTSYSNIAATYARKGELDKALEFYNKALLINERIFGNEHSNTQEVLLGMGELFISKGEKENGLKYLGRVQRTDYAKADLLIKYALGLFKQALFPESINLNLAALNFLEKSNVAQTDLHWSLLYHNLAKAYWHNGNKEKAVPLFEKAINLATIANAGGDYLEALTKSYEACKRQ